MTSLSQRLTQYLSKVNECIRVQNGHLLSQLLDPLDDHSFQILSNVQSVRKSSSSSSSSPLLQLHPPFGN